MSFKSKRSPYDHSPLHEQRKDCEPEGVDKRIEALAQLCWTQDPAERPSFGVVVELLAEVRDKPNEVVRQSIRQDKSLPLHYLRELNLTTLEEGATDESIYEGHGIQLGLEANSMQTLT